VATFHYLHLRAFAHETEDPAKVRQALDHVVAGTEAAWTETSVEGSHKNRVLILEGEVKSAPAAKRLFGGLARDDPPGFRRLREEAARRVDEHLNFYLRLDKQEAYLGRTLLAQDEDAITVRGKIRFFGTKRDGLAEAAAAAQVAAFLDALDSPGAA
jgi:RNA binding exosome subunit